MHRCPQCGRRLRLVDDLCPDCSAPSESEFSQSDEAPLSVDDKLSVAHKPGVTIARLSNGAEAGYFADELSRATGIEVEVVARERFDGVHAVWSIDYVLMAPHEGAERAAQMLQKLVDHSDDREDCTADESPGGETSTAVWAPLLLTLAAGSIACWGVERIDQRPRVRPAALVDRDPRQAPDLWHLLGATPGVWVQKSPDGKQTRELRLDPEHQTAVLREDQNGDGAFDREWEFDWKRR